MEMNCESKLLGLISSKIASDYSLRRRTLLIGKCMAGMIQPVNENCFRQQWKKAWHCAFRLRCRRKNTPRAKVIRSCASGCTNSVSGMRSWINGSNDWEKFSPHQDCVIIIGGNCSCPKNISAFWWKKRRFIEARM